MTTPMLWRYSTLVFSLGLFLPSILLAQAVNPGEWMSPRDQEKSLSRHDKATKGSSLEDFVQRLKASDPETRKQAVQSLGGSEDPRAVDYLMQAVDDADSRVAAKALEILGKKRATGATEFLTERLYLAGTSAPLRDRILLTLGEIGDSKAATPVLDFVKTTTDLDTRGVGIQVLGELADSSLRPELERLAGSESDPRLKRLIAEAITRIAAREAAAAEVPSKATVVTEGSAQKKR